MPFSPRKELRKVNSRIGWLCIVFTGCVVTFFGLGIYSFFPGTEVRTAVLILMLVVVIVGTWSGTSLDRCLEQRRNLELQVKYEYSRRKRGF